MANFFTSLVGSKPTVPDLKPLSLSVEQQKALTANLQALPQAERVAGKVNTFNQQQIDQMLERIIPNYKGITGAIGGNIEDLTKGIVPQDVQDVYQRSDAAKFITGGLGQEQLKNLTARDLGRTSLDLTLKGQQAAQSWIQSVAQLYEPGMFNISSMFVTPQQMAAFDTQERNAQFQAQWMRNQIEAMPAPWAEDLKQFIYRAMSVYSGTPVQGNPYSGGGGIPQANFGTAPGASPSFNWGTGPNSPGMFGTPSGPEGTFTSPSTTPAGGGGGGGISGLAALGI